MHEWDRAGINENAKPFEYKGLTFPIYVGPRTRDEIRSGNTYYAFYGNQHMTARSIRYYVDQMIATGQVAA